MILVKILVGVLLLAVLFAPKYVFRKIDELMGEDRPELQVYMVEPSTVIQQDPKMGGELDRYTRLKAAYESAPNPTMKKIWEHQLAQMDRVLRWRRLEEFAGGVSR